MKRIHYFFLIACLWIALPVSAEKYNPYQLTITGSRVMKTGNALQMEFVVDYRNLTVPSNNELLVSPVIIGEQDTLRLPFLLFPGKTRDKVNQRKVRLYGEEENFPQPYATLYPSGETDDILAYRTEIPFQPWMYGARLELQQDIYGCADCHRVLSSIPLNTIANPPQVAFIIPLADYSQEERTTLYVSFPWDQAVILPGFRNNASELAKIDRSMQKVNSDRPGKLRQITLTGYASPEGTYPYNTRLAGRRVQAVKNYVTQKYPGTASVFALDTVPEDWQGVRRWADSSDLRYRTQVMDIIDHTSNPDARDNRIRRLDGSATYHRLLREAYPPLRRVEFVVNYERQPLSLEQYREIYQTHPERLTPYELYSLAQSYPGESPEFYDIILVTARLYPEDAVANNNAVAVALQHEDQAIAREYLLRCGDNAQTLNNQGVLLLLEGKIPEACTCFRNAYNKGCNDAMVNLHNLERANLIP